MSSFSSHSSNDLCLPDPERSNRSPTPSPDTFSPEFYCGPPPSVPMTASEYWTRTPSPPAPAGDAIYERPRRRRNNAARRRRRRAARANRGRSDTNQLSLNYASDATDSDQEQTEFPQRPNARLPRGMSLADLTARALFSRVQLTYWALESYLRGSSHRQIRAVMPILVTTVVNGRRCIEAISEHLNLSINTRSLESSVLGEYMLYFLALHNLAWELPFRRNRRRANQIMSKVMACKILFESNGSLQHHAGLVDSLPFQRLQPFLQ